MIKEYKWNDDFSLSPHRRSMWHEMLKMLPCLTVIFTRWQRYSRVINLHQRWWWIKTTIKDCIWWWAMDQGNGKFKGRSARGQVYLGPGCRQGHHQCPLGSVPRPVKLPGKWQISQTYAWTWQLWIVKRKIIVFPFIYFLSLFCVFLVGFCLFCVFLGHTARLVES